MRRGWYVTEEDILYTLDAVVQAVPNGRDAIMRSPLFSFEAHLRHGFPLGADVIGALRRWLEPNSDANKVIVAAIVLGWIGTADAEQWWETLEPSDPGAHNAWSQTLDVLKRRRWRAEAMFG
jgi:hypothetical protein